MTEQPESAVEVKPGDTWQHVKRGTTYEVIGIAELQAMQPQGDYAELAIYRGADGKLWARNTGEFSDGRFVRLATQPAEAQGAGVFVRVPVVATAAILEAIINGRKTGTAWALDLWRDIIAAAPQAPAGGEDAA